MALFAASVTYLGVADKPWDHSEVIAALRAEGEIPTLSQSIAVGLWWAAAANAGLSVLLFLTSRAWTGSAGNWRPLAPSRSDQPRMGARSFWTLLLLAVVLGGGVRWNLANRSLWWDELWNVKQTVVGRYSSVDSPEQEPKFREASLSRALWYYRKPTNHCLNSVLSRTSVVTWQKLSGAQEHEFTDFVVRLPAFIATLGSIFGIGCLLRLWRLDVAGLAAAVFLAIHPWYIRYGIDARAYTFLVMLTIAGCLCLTWIARSKRDSWAPWICFGFAQFLIVWNFLLTIWLAAAFFLAALVLVWRRGGDWQSRRAMLGRLVLVNVLAGMAFVQIFAPNLLQLQRSIDKIGVDGPPINIGLVLQAFGELVFGMPAREALSAAGPVLFWATAAVVLLLVLAGGILALRRAPYLALILGSVIGAVAVYLLTAAALGQYFYTRFIIHGIVPIVALLGLGVEMVLAGIWGRQGAGAPLRKTAASLAALGVVALFVACSWSRIWLYQTRPYAPMRDVAEFLQEEVRSSPGGASILGYGLGGDIMRIYEPRVQFVRSREEIDRACREADLHQRELYLFYGYEGFNRAVLVDGFDLIDDQTAFEEVAAFAGIEQEFYFRILRYLGGESGADQAGAAKKAAAEMVIAGSPGH
ncbi:MAG: hypothetical protein ACR2RV_01935 [Verrucomicrobiales bacterium]